MAGSGGIRGRVEHEDWTVDAAELWTVVTAEFPDLSERLEALLPAQPLWRYQSDDRRAEASTHLAGASAPLVDPVAQERFYSLLDSQSDALDRLCTVYDVRSIHLFGSVLRDDFRPDSDVDMMVDFGRNRPRLEDSASVPRGA